jgi:hypothetical protein
MVEALFYELAQFLMRLMDFSIFLVLPIALWP